MRSPTGKQKRGASLVELLISMGMASLALILLTALISRGNAWYRSVQAKTEAHHEVLKTLDKIRADLSQSASASLTFHYPSGDPTMGDLALAFLTPYDRDGNFSTTRYTSQPIYADYKVYYHDLADQTLKSARTQYLPVPPISVLIPTPIPVSTLAGVLSSGGRVLTQNLREFSVLDMVTGQPTAASQNPVRLRVVVSVPVQGSNDQRESVAESIIRLPI